MHACVSVRASVVCLCVLACFACLCRVLLSAIRRREGSEARRTSSSGCWLKEIAMTRRASSHTSSSIPRLARQARPQAREPIDEESEFAPGFTSGALAAAVGFDFMVSPYSPRCDPDGHGRERLRRPVSTRLRSPGMNRAGVEAGGRAEPRRAPGEHAGGCSRRERPGEEAKERGSLTRRWLPWRWTSSSGLSPPRSSASR